MTRDPRGLTDVERAAIAAEIDRQIAAQKRRRWQAPRVKPPTATGELFPTAKGGGK